jgi:hypothetical protein
MATRGKNMMILGVIFLIIGITTLTISIVTLVNDNSMTCAVITSGGYCYDLFPNDDPYDDSQCCDVYGTCISKYFCNEDVFLVISFRYFGIGMVVFGIAMMILGCKKDRQDRQMMMAGFSNPLIAGQQGYPNQGQFSDNYLQGQFQGNNNNYPYPQNQQNYYQNGLGQPVYANNQGGSNHTSTQGQPVI